MNQVLGFTFPSPQQVIGGAGKENDSLIERKQRILTELAAIETGIDIFDFLDPARDNLQSSVTDAPCTVELLKVSGENKIPALNVASASADLASLIMEMGTKPPETPIDIPRATPKCHAIVNHSKVFFAQLKQLKEARSGLLTAFSVIPVSDKSKIQTPEPTVDDEATPCKAVHPFFPVVKGLKPLLGLMKKQLGGFPNFVRNPPNDAQCEELSLLADEESLRKHISEICGSSSDDEFNPDALLEQPLPGPAPTGHPYPHNIPQAGCR